MPGPDKVVSNAAWARDNILEVVRDNGSIILARSGTPILDGSERNGRLCFRFTKSSGAHTDFEVVGSATATGIEFSGEGNLRLGDLLLRSAEVHGTAHGIDIVAPAQWADYRTVLRFQEDTAPGHWRGQMDTRETLPCLMNNREILRISVTAEIDVHSRRSNYIVLAVLEGRNIEFAIEGTFYPDVDSLVKSLRDKTLAAVRQFLIEELRRCEAKLVAAECDDGGDEPSFAGATLFEKGLHRDSGVNLQEVPRRNNGRINVGFPDICPPHRQIVIRGRSQQSMATSIDGRLSRRPPVTCRNRLSKASLVAISLPQALVLFHLDICRRDRPAEFQGSFRD